MRVLQHIYVYIPIIYWHIYGYVTTHIWTTIYDHDHIWAHIWTHICFHQIIFQHRYDPYMNHIFKPYMDPYMFKLGDHMLHTYDHMCTHIICRHMIEKHTYDVHIWACTHMIPYMGTFTDEMQEARNLIDYLQIPERLCFEGYWFHTQYSNDV